jgi:hypothetical protein
MRLPWIQVADEARARAKVLAGLLGIPYTQALGMLVEIWAGALDWDHHDSAPTGVVPGPDAEPVLAVWAGWTGDPQKLRAALERTGFVCESGTGLRIRGMSRYVAVFEERKKDRERKAIGRQSDVRRTSAGIRKESTRETETETYTENPSLSEKGGEAAPDELVVWLAGAYHDAIRQPYTFRPKDKLAIGRLRKDIQAPDNVIIDVWCFALKSNAWPKVRDVAGLEAHWNTLLAQASERPRSHLLAVDRPRTA